MTENGIHGYPLLSEKTLQELGMVQYSADGKFAEQSVKKIEKTESVFICTYIITTTMLLRQCLRFQVGPIFVICVESHMIILWIIYVIANAKCVVG